MNRKSQLLLGLVGSLPLFSLARIIPGANRGQGRKESEMRSVGLLRYAIGLAWILLILAGCAIPPDWSIAGPSATPPSPEVVCTCYALVDIEVYVDQNANGLREAGEEPLQGARFRVEWQDPYKSPTSPKTVFHVESDVTGQAQYDVLACCFSASDDPGSVYAEAPPDYRLTTSDRCRDFGGCIFGFAPLNATPSSLREADLHGADLHGADLRGEDLKDADLTGANLCKANLQGAKLCNAELSGGDLQEADLRDADLTGANLREAYLRMANLSNAQMSGAVLVEADLLGADLSDADLQGADLSHARLGWTELHGADLRGADLHGADLRDADLRDLRDADLTGAKYDRYTMWPEGFDPSAAGAVLEE